MRRLSIMWVGITALAMVAGCAPRYAYYQEHHHAHPVKGYYLSDGTYVKVNPGLAHGHYKVQQKVVKKKVRRH